MLPGFEYLDRFLQDFRRANPHSDRNVFVMLPFSTKATNAIFDATRAEIEDHGLIALRADQRKFSPVLWWNVVTYILGCSYGIVIYEPTDTVRFNPNVSIEAGFMLALDRPVLFLVNDSLSTLPVDFAGHIFKQYSAESRRVMTSIRTAVRDWIEHDLSYCDYGSKKLIVFASLGGTCRCVMAKAIFSEFLQREKISGVAVEAAAIADPHYATVSPSAIKALSGNGWDRWIEGHRPRKLSRFLQDRADLIIAFTDPALARVSHTHSNVVTDNEVLGERVLNPYPDTQDDAAAARYTATRDQITSLISSNFLAILDRLGARPGV